ncbi:MAG: hypothetical protein IJS74_02755 [Clostridia bacterium]|nr:hypothetical protein [Clostridia bacterium]
MKKEDQRKVIRLDDLMKIVNTTGREDSKGWIVARLMDLGYVKKDSESFLSVKEKYTEEELRKMVVKFVKIDKKDTERLLRSETSSLKNVLLNLGYEEKELKGKSREQLEQIAVETVGDKSLLKPSLENSSTPEKKVTKFSDFIKDHPLSDAVTLDDKIKEHQERVKSRQREQSEKKAIKTMDMSVSLDNKIKEHKERVAKKRMPKTVKKVWDKVRVQEVINADEETLRADAIWAGYSQSAIKGKNTQELRSMIFDKVKLDNQSMISVLSSPSISQLKQVLVGYGASWDDVASKERDELEKMYISRVGLDDIIEARDDVKKQELIYGSKLNHRYENSLIALRRERGKEIAKELKTIKTPEARETFLNGLSQAEREDVVSYQSVKNLAKDAARIQNEFIENALT